MTTAQSDTSPQPVAATPRVRRGDRVFSGGSRFAAIIILFALAAVALFLIAQSLPALFANAEDIPIVIKNADSFLMYVVPLVFGTLWAAAIALLIALPLSIGIALFISHYAPRRLANVLGYIIDLLAAVPSVVFGLWGIKVLAPAVVPFYGWLTTNLGWLPFFTPPASGTGRTVLTVAIVLAVMIIPIISAISREVFLQTPKLNEEAALALGATRWEMIRTAVLPPAQPGIVSAAMLGLGRALGETMVVAMVLSPSVVITFALTSSTNSSTIAGNIALQFPEAAGLSVNALIATGLVLFVITFLVNAAARWVVARKTITGVSDS